MAKQPKPRVPRWLPSGLGPVWERAHPWVIGPAVYLGVRTAIAGLTAGGLRGTLSAAARAGEAYARSPLGRRSLRRATTNLAFAFPEWSQDEVRHCAIRSHGHLAQIGVEIAYAPRLLSDEGWMRHLDTGDISRAVRALVSGRPCVLITGHCGNWELIGYTIALLGFPMHALYRPLDNAPLDRWLRETRERRGLVLVDKFGAVRQLPRIMSEGGPTGFVADQNGGDRGVFVPFFNRLTSTYKSIGLLAMQFGATMVCGFARRKEPGEPGRGEGLGYAIELTDVFGPEEWRTHPDPLFYLTARYRWAIERMVRRAPEQYLWMHRIWRSRPHHERSGKPFPPALREKLSLLPWLGAEDLERIAEHSARDARTLAETGQSRLS